MISATVPEARVQGSHLFGLLVEDGRHGEDGGALVQRGSKALPVLVQLTGDLFDLRRGVMTGFGESTRHRHDSVDVDVGVLQEGQHASVSPALPGGPGRTGPGHVRTMEFMAKWLC